MSDFTNEPALPDEEIPDVFELTNMKVFSVGLVPEGANNLQFFLTKRKEAVMPDVTIEKGTDDRSLIEMLKSWLPNAVKEAIAEAAPPPADVDVLPGVTMEEVEKRFEALQAQSEAALEAVKGSYEAEIAKLQTQVEATQTQLSEAQTDAELAKATAEKAGWIEKAGNMTFSLPITKEQLGEKLLTLAHAVPDDIDWLVDLLKTVDHQLTEAGLFNEFGTSASDEQSPYEKAVKRAKEDGVTLEQALLDLSPEDQLTIMKGGN